MNIKTLTVHQKGSTVIDHLADDIRACFFHVRTFKSVAYVERIRPAPPPPAQEHSTVLFPVVFS